MKQTVANRTIVILILISMFGCLASKSEIATTMTAVDSGKVVTWELFLEYHDLRVERIKEKVVNKEYGPTEAETRNGAMADYQELKDVSDKVVEGLEAVQSTQKLIADLVDRYQGNLPPDQQLELDKRRAELENLIQSVNALVFSLKGD